VCCLKCVLYNICPLSSLTATKERPKCCCLFLLTPPPFTVCRHLCSTQASGAYCLAGWLADQRAFHCFSTTQGAVCRADCRALPLLYCWSLCCCPCASAAVHSSCLPPPLHSLLLDCCTALERASCMSHPGPCVTLDTHPRVFLCCRCCQYVAWLKCPQPYHPTQHHSSSSSSSGTSRCQ